MGKTLNKDNCTDCKVDTCKEKLIFNDSQDRHEDEFIGEEIMKTVQEKKASWRHYFRRHEKYYKYQIKNK